MTQIEMHTLDASQLRAVEMFERSAISVMTGGPGTGKTTTLAAILAACDARQHTYVLCAPTGKAARRMSELTGIEAYTIHRLIGYRGPSAPALALKSIAARVLVVDEASMLDVELAAALFNCINSAYTRVLFVGDVDQLPPVGPGAFLRDLIDSKNVPVTVLRQLHRSAEGSWVCRNAPRVLTGQELELDTDVKDFEMYDVADEESVPEAAVEAALSSRYADVQVLSPQRLGAAGVHAINTAMQESRNPDGDVIAHSDTHELRAGDRVMHVINDYDKNVFNGEVGTLELSQTDGAFVRFDPSLDAVHTAEKLGWSTPTPVFVRYSLADVKRQLILSYCSTIHKSQGSQWDHLVVVCHSSHQRMLSRQLLYTAITRAKKFVTLIGDDVGISHALNTVADAHRRTRLKQQLRLHAREVAR